MAEFIPIPQVYAAGRLDADSEGLLLLTSNGRLQQRLTDPRFGHWRRYWVQVEGEAAAHPEALELLRSGLLIQGQRTLPARVEAIAIQACQSAPRQSVTGPPFPPAGCNWSCRKAATVRCVA